MTEFGAEDEQAVLGYAVRTAAELGREILPYSLRYTEKRRTLFSHPHTDKIRMVNAFCDSVHNICELFTSDTWNKGEYHEIFIAPFQKKKVHDRYGSDV